METLIRLLIGLLLAFAAAVSGSGPAEPASAPGSDAPMPNRSLTIIEAVQVQVLESFPMQLRLNVSGQQPDGCQLPVQVEQMRTDNHVMVEIFREVPPGLFCPMVLQPYSDHIALEGGFISGVVTIDVNGFVVEVAL